MSLVAPLQSRFDGGEISPLYYGRVDSDRYKSSLALCKNWISTLQGGLPRRPGSYYINQTKGGLQARIIPFQFSTTQAYILEFGQNYIRFYENYGQLQSGGAAYEVATPYSIDQVFALKFTQSADVLYLACDGLPPAKLERLGATNWQYVPIAFQDGPYLPIFNIPQYYAWALSGASITSGHIVTLSLSLPGTLLSVGGCSANSDGTIKVTLNNPVKFNTGDTVTVQNVTGTTEANGTWQIAVIDDYSFKLLGSVFVHAWINGGSCYQVLLPSDYVGRVIRLQDSTQNWCWGTITSYVSDASVTILLHTTAAATGIIAWAIGVWGVYAGLASYPSVVTFHQDRLCFTGAPNNPQRLDASMSGDYEHFAPSANGSGTVADNNALSFNLNANDVNVMEWLDSDENGLLGGSVSAEWAIKPSLNSEALSPTNISAARSTGYGSNGIQAIRVGKACIFAQRGGRKVREMIYNFYLNGYAANDLTELAEHITGGGVIDMAFAGIPMPIVWFVREDGALLGMTYDRDVQNLRVAWHWHVLGGQSDALGTPAKVESIAVIPSPDGTRDDLWMVVKRYINGQTIRTIEYLTKVFEDIDPQVNAFFLDCGLTLNSPTPVTTVSMLNFLQGETVSIYADGAVQPPQVVPPSGTITLQTPAKIVSVGYSYNSDGQQLRLEAGARNGTSLGKIRRTHRIGLMVHRSQGLMIGPNFSALDPVEMRTQGVDLQSGPPQLFSGITSQTLESDYDFDNQFCFRVSQPVPCTLLAIMPMLETQDRS